MTIQPLNSSEIIEFTVRHLLIAKNKIRVLTRNKQLPYRSRLINWNFRSGQEYWDRYCRATDTTNGWEPPSREPVPVPDPTTSTAEGASSSTTTTDSATSSPVPSPLPSSSTGVEPSPIPTQPPRKTRRDDIAIQREEERTRRLHRRFPKLFSPSPTPSTSIAQVDPTDPWAWLPFRTFLLPTPPIPPFPGFPVPKRIGVLKIGSFTTIKIPLLRILEDLKERGVERLVVDVSNNFGGDPCIAQVCHSPICRR